jgi:hypothetical protein
MEKVIRSFRNASTSSSESLIKLFRGKMDAKELLANTSIIKKMKIGMSYLTEENKPTFLNDIFGSEFTHTSIYFIVELPLNKKTGIIVQYGKYNFTDKDKSGNKINNIGFPYGKEGGLMFGEMDEKTFEENFCTFGNINCILGKNFPKTTFKNFLEQVKKINGPWDLKSYDAVNKSCQNFVVAAIQVIKPGFSEQFVTIKAENNQIPVIINNELKKREVFIDC